MNWLKAKLRVILGELLYKNAYSRRFFTLFGIVIEEVRVSFRQFFSWKHPLFTIYRVAAIIFSALIRLVLGRSLKYSFAFTGEDNIIEGIYKPIITQNGFYVDVGCNHPVFLSNTYFLYRRGWRGICIDANKNLINKFKYYRPKDIAISSLVSDSTEVKDFYILQNDVLSTSEAEFLEEYKKEGLEINKVKLKPRTLTSILDESHAPSEIDILSIDAEEHDFNVLKSLDFERYFPKLIVVEDETFAIQKPYENKIFEFLNSKDYELTGFVLKNMYFLKKNL